MALNVHYHQNHARIRPIMAVVTRALMERVHVNAKINIINGMTLLTRVLVLQITLNISILAVNN